MQGSCERAPSIEGASNDRVYLSDFKCYCQGTKDPNSYLVALNVTGAKVKKKYGHSGSDNLDRINAFDRAEVARVNMGQLNLIQVSSFCSPQGFLWGVDLADARTLHQPAMIDVLPRWDGMDVPIYNGDFLIDAATELFGTLETKRFPLAPGTHCPTAIKHIETTEPGTIYAACGIGYAEKISSNATILMEDIGFLSDECSDGVLNRVARSVLAVAKNQQSKCKCVFVSMTTVTVAEGEVGCCMTMVPYFGIARNALPEGGLDAMRKMSLEQWRNQLEPALQLV